MKHIFSREYWDQRDVEQYIGKLLRYGVILSSIITVFGVLFIYFSTIPKQRIIRLRHRDSHFRGLNII